MGDVAGGGLADVLSSCFGGLLQVRGDDDDRRKAIACVVAFGTVRAVEEAVLRSSDALAELASTACDADLDAMLQVGAAAELVARVGSDTGARLTSLRALKHLTRLLPMRTDVNRSSAAVARACDAVAAAGGVRVLAAAVADAARTADATSPVAACGCEAATVLHNIMRFGSAQVRRASVEPEPEPVPEPEPETEPRNLDLDSSAGATGASIGSDISASKGRCTANTLLSVLQLTRDEGSPLLRDACAALAHAARCTQVRSWLMSMHGAPVVTELMLDLVDSTGAVAASNAAAVHGVGDKSADTAEATVEVTLFHCVSLVRWLAQLAPGRAALVREGVVAPLVQVSRRFAQQALSFGSTSNDASDGAGALVATTAAAACTALELLCRTEHPAVVAIAAEGGIVALVSICSAGAPSPPATAASAAAAQLLCRLAMNDSVKQQVQRAGAFRPLLRLADASAKAVQGAGTDLERSPLPSISAAHSLYAAAASVSALSESQSDGASSSIDGCVIMVRALQAAASAILALGAGSRNRWHLTSLLLAAASHAANALRTYFHAAESSTTRANQDAKASAIPALATILRASAGAVEEATFMLTRQDTSIGEGEGRDVSGAHILRLAWLRATASAAAALRAASHAAPARAALLAYATSGLSDGVEDEHCFVTFAVRIITASKGSGAMEVTVVNADAGNVAGDRPQGAILQESFKHEGLAGDNDAAEFHAADSDSNGQEYKYDQGFDDDPENDEDDTTHDTANRSNDTRKHESVRLLITRSAMELAAMVGEFAKRDDSCRPVAPMALRPLVWLLHTYGSASDTATIPWDKSPGDAHPSAVSAAAEALATFVSANVAVDQMLQLPSIAVAACVRVAESCQKTKAGALVSHAQSLHMCARLLCALGTRASERGALVTAGAADALASTLRVARALNSLARQLQHLPSGDEDAKWTAQASAHGTFAAHHASATAALIAVDARLRGALVFDSVSTDDGELTSGGAQPSALLLLLVQQLGAFESTKMNDISTRERVGPSWSLPASKPTEAIALGARAAAAALSMLGQVRSARTAMVRARAPAALFSMIAKALSCPHVPGELPEEAAEDVNHALAVLHMLAADTLASESPMKFEVAATLLDGTQQSAEQVVMITRAIVARLQRNASGADAPTTMDAGDEVLLVGATGAVAAICGVSAAPAVLTPATVRRLIAELDVVALLSCVSRLLMSARANHAHAPARRRAALCVVRAVERLTSVSATHTHTAQSVALRLLQQNVCEALNMALASSPADIDDDSRLALATLQARVTLMQLVDIALRSSADETTGFGEWFQVHSKALVQGVQQATQRADVMTKAASTEAATLAITALSHALRLATVARVAQRPSNNGAGDTAAIETDGSALDMDITFEAVSCNVILTLRWCMETISIAICDSGPANTPRRALRALRVSATLCEALASTCASATPARSGHTGDELLKLILKADGGILQPLSSTMRACVAIAAPWSQKVRSHLASQHRMAAALEHDGENKDLMDDLVTSIGQVGLRLAGNQDTDLSQAEDSDIERVGHTDGAAIGASLDGAPGDSVRTIGGVVIDGEGADFEMAIFAVLAEIARSSANAIAQLVAQRSAKRAFSAGVSSATSMISALLYTVATFGVGAPQALPRVLGTEALLQHFNRALDAAGDTQTPSPVNVNLRPEMLAASSSTIGAATASVTAIRNLARLPAGRRLLLQHVMEDPATNQSPGAVTLDVLLALCRAQQHRLAFAVTSESQQCSLPTWWIWLAQQGNGDTPGDVPHSAAVRLLHRTLELLSVGTGALANVALDRESRALATTAAPRIFGLQCASLRPLPPCESVRALNGDISKVVATLLRNTAAAVSLVARDGVPGGGAHEVLEVGCATHVVMIVLETVQQRRQVIEGADSSPGVDKDLWALLKFCVNVVFNLVAVVNDGGDGQVGAAGDGRRRELAVEADAARALSLVLGLLRDDQTLSTSQADTKARQQLARSAAGAIAALALHADTDAAAGGDATERTSNANGGRQQRSNTQLVVDVAGAPHAASPILCLALATLAHGGAALAMKRETAGAATEKGTAADQAQSRRQMEADHAVTVALTSTATSLARVVICAGDTLSDLFRQSAPDVAPLAAVIGVTSAATATIADTAGGGGATAEARMAQRSLAAARAVLLPRDGSQQDNIFSAFGLDAAEFDALLSAAERILLPHCTPRSGHQQ